MKRISNLAPVLIALSISLSSGLAHAIEGGGALTKRIVVNVPARKAALYEGDGAQPTFVFKVAVGKRGTPTPTGKWQIGQIRKDPTWYVPKSIQNEMAEKNKPVLTSVPPGPSNPLGPRFIRAGQTAYGLHGTIAPESIGKSISHGCVRMNNADVVLLAEQVSTRDFIEFIYDRVEIETSPDAVTLAVHPDIYRKQPLTLESLRSRIQEQLTLAQLENVDWPLVQATLTQSKGKPVLITGVRPSFSPPPEASQEAPPAAPRVTSAAPIAPRVLEPVLTSALRDVQAIPLKNESPVKNETFIDGTLARKYNRFQGATY